LKLKGTLRNGIESGTWTEWHENGQKKSERSFLNGIPLGTWKEWDKNGKLTKEKKWN
jgi:antitoxin component YwqK of YwqJK toxin-antitoxin module